MKKKKNLIASLHAKLMYEVIVAQKRTNHHIFVDWSGHVNLLEVRVSFDGWRQGVSSNKIFYVFNPNIKDLKEAIRKVKALK